MTIDRAGIPFIVAPTLAGGTLWLVGQPAIGAALLLIAAAITLFFRDPERPLPAGVSPEAVLAPADGTVLHAGEPDPEAAPEGAWWQVSIFLSLLDVHVNRVPIGGQVVSVNHRPGRFLPAFRQHAADRNERTEVLIDHDGQPVVFHQVVGVLARRVVCRIEPGMEVAQGQRFGIMKFGSRMDLFVPRSAKLAVAVGQTVRGGETVLARLAACGETLRRTESGEAPG